MEERTEKFARRVGEFVEGLSQTTTNLEYGKQLIKSSGSVGANYIESNEALGKKDFAMRIKICRKEAKESGYWLRLVHCFDKEKPKQESLIQEATELMKIFGAIQKNEIIAFVWGSFGFLFFSISILFRISIFVFRI